MMWKKYNIHDIRNKQIFVYIDYFFIWDYKKYRKICASFELNAFAQSTDFSHQFARIHFNIVRILKVFRFSFLSLSLTCEWPIKIFTAWAHAATSSGRRLSSPDLPRIYFRFDFFSFLFPPSKYHRKRGPRSRQPDCEKLSSQFSPRDPYCSGNWVFLFVGNCKNKVQAPSDFLWRRIVVFLMC